jgi:hypothetical protein
MSPLRLKPANCLTSQFANNALLRNIVQGGVPQSVEKVTNRQNARMHDSEYSHFMSLRASGYTGTAIRSSFRKFLASKAFGLTAQLGPYRTFVRLQVRVVCLGGFIEFCLSVHLFVNCFKCISFFATIVYNRYNYQPFVQGWAELCRKTAKEDI